MVENLDIELEEIIEMINIQKEKRNIQLQSFTWRYYTFKYRGQRGVGVTNYDRAPRHEMLFENWMDALTNVKSFILADLKNNAQ
ncbi:hypothetical protein COJ01_18165 [Priestia megaterium]|uniref:hypothetical protein n=1 Tax=Priestia megaterium TaxID=1404 RepID=UPI000BF90251|nr:hypothetical protein [Priestia megaterium]PFK99970.1 hypothetical protein COJ01_18165 [Priestia megaterium]